jgi:GDP-L-fucose synthase
MDKSAKIFITGHRGLAGSAVVRALQRSGYNNLLLRTHAELDLIDQRAVSELFEREKPEFVFHIAAKMGGIWAAMTESAEFIYENLMMQSNVIHSSYVHGVKKLLFVGSTSIFPRACPQPIREEYLLSGPMEPSNESYAIAKIAGIEMCQAYDKQYRTNFITALATNLYGPNDNYDISRTHVFAAMIRKFHDAVREGQADVSLWGTGTPRREFLHADDFADACLFLMDHYDDPSIVNIGTGEDICIRDLAEKIRTAAGHTGNVTWDPDRPDGMPRKWLDVSKLHALGWTHQIHLDEGIRRTLDWFSEQS